MSTELDRVTLIFQELGLTRIEGRILYVLLAGNPLSARDIERSADLRQPELSKGIKMLLEREWITEKLDISVGIRKPRKMYILKFNTEKIYSDIYCRNMLRSDALNLNLKELKEILKVK